MLPLSPRRMPAYSRPSDPEKRSEMSPVVLPPGTQMFSAHVAPPSVET